jgi:glyoxylase-like metal-dependent hydrolase (beta-lactamase superfamily II)
MGMANAFLMAGDDGLPLIDAGLPNRQAPIFEAIRGLSRSPNQLKHLIFTHGHPDHIGSAAAIVVGEPVRGPTCTRSISRWPRVEALFDYAGAPGLLRQVMCKLFDHPDERLESVATDQHLADGE